MKRMTAWLLVLCICLGLCACGNGAVSPETSAEPTAEATVSAAKQALDGKKSFLSAIPTPM